MAELHLPHAGTAPRPAADVPPGHEESDVNIAGVFGFALSLVVAGVFISFVVWVLFGFFQSRAARRGAPEYPLAVERQNRLPPEPRLQTDPRQDLLNLRRQEDEILNSYGWVDKNAGIVRIPIEQAMKITLERGLPTRQN
jgi:hypothetical protein